MGFSSFASYFDAVIMLTWSNWHTESRKNRYQYATRFASLLPVVFVQPDLELEEFKWEATSVSNLEILHISREYNQAQSDLLNRALLSRNIITPLWWIYNFAFYDYIKTLSGQFKVYHATEDYFSKDFPSRIQKNDNLYKKLLRTVNSADLLVSVSSGVEDNYLKYSRFKGRSIVATNGCDYNFFAPDISKVDFNVTKNKNTALFQGNIFGDKLDYQLISQLAENMPDWEFSFCGPVLYNEVEWRKLLEHSNCKYLGNLHIDALRDIAQRATAGIIPFRNLDFVIERLFPLKAFEYLACGLPVVTVKIKSLIPYGEVFIFAEGAKSFEEGLRQAAKIRYEKESFIRRLHYAKQQDYDVKFEYVCSEINTLLQRPKAAMVSWRQQLVGGLLMSIKTLAGKFRK